MTYVVNCGKKKRSHHHKLHHHISNVYIKERGSFPNSPPPPKFSISYLEILLTIVTIVVPTPSVVSSSIYLPIKKGIPFPLEEKLKIGNSVQVKKER